MLWLLNASFVVKAMALGQVPLPSSFDFLLLIIIPLLLSIQLSSPSEDFEDSGEGRTVHVLKYHDVKGINLYLHGFVTLALDGGK